MGWDNLLSFFLASRSSNAAFLHRSRFPNEISVRIRAMPAGPRAKAPAMVPSVMAVPSGVRSYDEKTPHLFPNPVTTEATLLFGHAECASVGLYDLTGHLLRRWVVNGDDQIRISREGLKAGLYLLKIIDKGLPMI